MFPSAMHLLLQINVLFIGQSLRGVVSHMTVTATILLVAVYCAAVEQTLVPQTMMPLYSVSLK